MRSYGGRPVMSSPKKRMRPAVGGKSPVIGIEQRGLAGAVGAEHGAPLAGRDRAG